METQIITFDNIIITIYRSNDYLYIEDNRKLSQNILDKINIILSNNITKSLNDIINIIGEYME